MQSQPYITGFKPADSGPLARFLPLFPIGALLILGGAPLAIQTSRIILREYRERSLVRANATTIQLHAIAGLLMAAGIFWSDALARLLGL